MEQQDSIRAFWSRFLKETGRDPETKYFDCYHFDVTKQGANQLLELVLRGVKKATSSSGYFFQRNGMPLPKAGDLNLITDWDGVPRCVVETVRVTVLPFRDMTFSLCRLEGEDDCLESWQKGHVRFFTAEGKAEGYAFSWDMPVVFEEFRVIYSEE